MGLGRAPVLGSFKSSSKAPPAKRKRGTLGTRIGSKFQGGPGSVCQFTLPKPSMSSLRCFAVRLLPGEEIKEALLKFVEDYELKAAFVLSCVGSVRCAKLRLADETKVCSYIFKK